MINRYLTKLEQKTFKTFLTNKDCKLVAKETNYSESTVNKILGCKTKLNDTNVTILNEFMKLTEIRMIEKLSLIHKFNDELILKFITT